MTTFYIKIDTPTTHTPRRHSTSTFEHVATHLSMWALANSPKRRQRTQHLDYTTTTTSDPKCASQNACTQTDADPSKGLSAESKTVACGARKAGVMHRVPQHGLGGAGWGWSRVGGVP